MHACQQLRKNAPDKRRCWPESGSEHSCFRWAGAGLCDTRRTYRGVCFHQLQRCCHLQTYHLNLNTLQGDASTSTYSRFKYACYTARQLLYEGQVPEAIVVIKEICPQILEVWLTVATMPDGSTTTCMQLQGTSLQIAAQVHMTCHTCKQISNRPCCNI